MYPDYTVNQDQYVFTNETFTLPIGIQLIGDRSGEGIESFDLTLAVSSQTSTSISADVVFPSQVTVVIIDDDCELVVCITYPISYIIFPSPYMYMHAPIQYNYGTHIIFILWMTYSCSDRLLK